MPTEILFQTHLVLGYVAWLRCFSAYVWPWLRSMDRVAAQRAIATLHSVVFILPGIVSPNLPAGFAGFATFAAYGDFATGVLAILALLTVRIRPLFRLFVVAFNLVGTVDLIVDYYNAIQVGLPALDLLPLTTHESPVLLATPNRSGALVRAMAPSWIAARTRSALFSDGNFCRSLVCTIFSAASSASERRTVTRRSVSFAVV
jgi:hypothetical protein